MMDEFKLLVIAVLWAMVSATIDWDNRLVNNNRPFPNGTEIELTPNAAFIDTVCPPGSGNITLKCHNVKGGIFQGSKNDTDNHLVITCDPLKGLVCNPDTNATMNATCPDFYLQYGCDKPDSGRTNYTKTTPLTSTTSTSVPSGNGTGMSAAHATNLSIGSTKFTPPPGGSLGKRCTCNGGNHVVINKKLVSLITIVCLIKRLVY